MRIRRFSRGDDGFTIVEATIALVLIFSLLLILLRAFDGGVRRQTQAQRTQVAQLLAEETMERARSVDWDQTGLDPTLESNTCPAHPGCGTWRSDFGITGTPGSDADPMMFDGQELKFLDSGSAYEPFEDFHQQVTRDGIEMETFVFVTSQMDTVDPTLEIARRITTVVRWDGGGVGKEVRMSSLNTEFAPPPAATLSGQVNYVIGGFDIESSKSDDPLSDDHAIVYGTVGHFDPGKDPVEWKDNRWDVNAEMAMPVFSVSAATDFPNTSLFGWDASSSSTTYWLDNDPIREWFWDFDDGGDQVLYVASQDLSDGTNELASTAFEAIDRWTVIPRTETSEPLFKLDDPDVIEEPPGPVYHDVRGDETGAPTITGEAWSAKGDDGDGNPGAEDGLPYAAATATPPSEITWYFEEFTPAGGEPTGKGQEARDDYGESNLTQPSYQYDIVRFIPNTGTYNATVDRTRTGAAELESVTADFSTQGGWYLFFYDDVAASNQSTNRSNCNTNTQLIDPNRYCGMVKIYIPDLTGSVKAGEDVAPALTTATGIGANAGRIVIMWWDPDTLSYQTPVYLDGSPYIPLAPTHSNIDFVHFDDNLGDNKYEYKDDGQVKWDNIKAFPTEKPKTSELKLKGSFVLHPLLIETEAGTVDTNDTVFASASSSGGMVEGQFYFKLKDDKVDTMYEYELKFTLGQVQATASFTEPD